MNNSMPFPDHDDDILNYLVCDSHELEENYINSQNLVDTYYANLNGSLNPVPSDCDMESRRVQKQKQKQKAQEKIRFVFKTKSTIDLMDDGFQWGKYGKKMVKSSPHPRNYFKCKSKECNVKKRVERDKEDSSFVITTYEGVHNHA